MPRTDVTQMLFSKLYPLLVAKAQKKGRTREEVDQVTSWLTGYSPEEIAQMEQSDICYGDFFRKAPAMNPNRFLITGKICGVKVGRNRRSPDAGDPVPGQAGGRAGPGQILGKNPAQPHSIP